MFGTLRSWLGPLRTQIVTGLLVSVVLAVVGLQLLAGSESWVFTAQLSLVWLLLVVLALVLHSRLPPQGRQRLWLMLGPGLALLAVGLLLPDMALFFGGGGLGWIVAAQFVLRNRMQMQYRAAVRHMRSGNYDAALEVMNTVIAAEPDRAENYRFRAEVYRLASRLALAQQDYERVIQLSPDAAKGYSGLAELFAQQGDYEHAHTYARQALEREPNQWLPAYNLGMIEDRRGNAAAAVEHLESAVAAGLPHSRYWLLTRLWLTRNYFRLEKVDHARRQVELMQRHISGLTDWQTVLASDQAAPLRPLLAEDIRLAKQLLAGETPSDVFDNS
ncbi:MAG: tetratricopeptide repeat protein [Chloroflexi bacterium]|nr:tetratricopeptide repeat protein [Chloroflexota bacterium]